MKRILRKMPTRLVWAYQAPYQYLMSVTIVIFYCLTDNHKVFLIDRIGRHIKSRWYFEIAVGFSSLIWLAMALLFTKIWTLI